MAASEAERLLRIARRDLRMARQLVLLEQAGVDVNELLPLRAFTSFWWLMLDASDLGPAAHPTKLATEDLPDIFPIWWRCSAGSALPSPTPPPRRLWWTPPMPPAPSNL